MPSNEQKLEREWRTKYLERLQQWLRLLVIQGNVSAEEAQNLYVSSFNSLFALKSGYRGLRDEFASTREDLEGAGNLPFLIDITDRGEITSVNEIAFRAKLKGEITPALQKQAKTRTAIHQYTPQLNEYLSAAVKAGQMDWGQWQQIINAETSMIQQGIDPKNLPNYQNVQDWITRLEKAEGTKWSDVKLKGWDMLQQQAAARALKVQEAQRQGQPTFSPNERLYRQAQQQQLVKAMEWEAQRQEAMRLPQDYGWLRRWQYERMENPFRWKSLAEREELDIEQSILGSSPQGMRELEREQQFRRVPPTPDWLARMTSLEAGEPVRGVPLEIPSGQQWSSLSSSQQAQWAGFADWTGAGAEDLLGRMAQMRTRTPRVAYQWSPARQRT